MSCVPFATPAALNYGPRVGDMLLNEWSWLGHIHQSIHSFPRLFTEHACILHPALIWYVGRGGGAKWDSVCWTFRWPWNFSTLHEDYFLEFQLCCDVLIFADENMKRGTHINTSRSSLKSIYPKYPSDVPAAKQLPPPAPSNNSSFALLTSRL